ncbi:SusC/RagA family TonB-linked outer membrane protein [Flavobacterium sp. 5]|uniref:SusC/RagA family TonB-linked outer membrane protein n=1 Tax=Flavobacterium sp. 5 TaxID=2035199 RepID=UPI000C2C8BBE|nr:SusC/RagA family TonB-linked outer membrane protein [Flavobacterium sp. 5]PKB17371.1 TonB-linked SusC/RagA family outer membrane protein [Flavobacterium sp. 5]
MKLKFNGFLVLLVVLVAQLTFAQERSVSGVVSDNAGMPLPGVSVLIKGTKNGTQSDFDGKFSIKAQPSDVLIFSYIGMKTSEKSANSTTINVKLASDATQLESVVVTGNAKGRSIKEMTYSVGQVNASALEKVPALDAITALQGKVSGLKINSASGEPGSEIAVQLRSANSLSTGQKPMVILDGVILEGGLADINTQDIERIEVVKGAAGASLYGSRAASGVIQIFSKRGKGLNGKSRITYRTESGFSNITNKLDLATQHKYELTPDGTDFAYDATGNRIVETDNLGNNPYPSKYKMYDLQDRVYRSGSFTSHHLAVEGGNDPTNFLLSYDRQDSKSVIDLTNTYSRNNFRLNLDHKISDKFKIGASMVYSNSKKDPFIMGNNGVLFDAIILEPISNLDAPNANGTPFLYQPSEFTTTEENPLYIIANNDRTEERNRFIGSYNAAYDVTKWFKATAEYSIDFEQSNFVDFFNKGYLGSKPRTNLNNGYLAKATFSGKAENLRAEGLFSKSFGDFNGNLKVGFLDERYKNDFSRTEGSGLAVSDIKTLDNLLGPTKQTTSRSEEIITDSYYGVLDADYLKRALFSVAYRIEGSSLFGENTRWNNYYRASGAYRIITSDSNINGIEEFKLRASIGTAGIRPLYGMRDETFTLQNGTASKSTLGNEELRPAVAKEIELGFNISFLKRFNAEFNYVKTNTDDQILLVPLNGLTGYSGQWRNAGEMEASSYEASLGVNIINNKDWNWDLNVLWDKSSQKVKRLDVPSYYTGPGTQESSFFLVAQGENFGAMYGDKFITTLNDLPSGLNQSDYNINSKGYVVSNTTGLPVKYKDDKGNTNVKIGDITPDFNMSFTTNLRYKDFTLYGLIYWKKGGDIYNKVKQWLYRDSRSADIQNEGLTDDFYASAAGLYNTNQASSAFVEDGSFVRLKECSLYYTLTKEKIGKNVGFIDEVKFGIVGRNLLTFTDYTGQDPEISSPSENTRTELTSRSTDGTGSNSNNPGGDPNVFKVDNFSYPTLKSFSLSVQFKF